MSSLDLEFDKEKGVVTWDSPDDPKNPKNFSFGRKIFITSIWVVSNLTTTIASSIFASGTGEIMKEFHVSATVTTLGVSLFLIGYTVGPPVWGPVSERCGRKWPTFVGMALFTIFCLPVALAKNIQTALIGRFLCGSFGAAPLSIIGGALVDIWNPIQRGVAMAIGIGTVFGSPMLAPLIGDFVAASYLGWRWTEWISGIMGLATSALILFGLPETHAPTILRRKAAHLRRTTGNNELQSEFDNQSAGLKDIINVFLVKSFKMLFTEPILLCITIYQSFIYGIAYLTFVSYPIAFREIRGWKLGVSGLPYLGMFVGVVFGAVAVVWHTKTKFTRRTRENNGVIIPEQRLPLMIVGACMLPCGLFIFAWTSAPNIHWSGMVVGSVPIGMAMYMIFVQCLNYVVDVYQSAANSAIGANTFMRSLFGAAFPLFGPTMYHHLGVDWATSTLAFFAIAMIPIPVVFFKYGHTIRTWSKNAVAKN